MNDQAMKKNVISGLFWKFGERITAQFISLLVSIILARLLAPKDYGTVALTMVFITIANVFVSSGFGNALIQKKDADNLDFSSVFFINIGFSIIIYLILFFAAPYIAAFYDMQVMAPALRVLGIRIILAAVNNVQQTYVSKNMLFKRFFWSTLIGTLVSGIVGVVIAYSGGGVWALVIQYLTNTCMDTLILWITVQWRPDFAFSWSRAKSLVSYGWKLLASSLLDTGYSQLRSLVIGKMYTSSDLAYYEQGRKYTFFLIGNINTSISSVLLPAMSLAQDNHERVKQMTRRSIQTSSYLIWPLMTGLAVIAEPFVRLLLTEKWLPCVPFLRIFCFVYVLWPIHTSNLQAINAMGRSEIFLKLEIVKKIASLGILLLCMQYGTLAIAAGLLADSLLGTVINAFPNKKLLNYGYFEQLRDIFPYPLMSFLMAAAIYPLGHMGLSDMAAILLQVSAGFVVYILLSIFFRQTILRYLLETLFKGRKK